MKTPDIFEFIYHVLLLAGDIYICGHETSIVYTKLINNVNYSINNNNFNYNNILCIICIKKLRFK